MCGICGFIGYGTIEDLKRMTSSMAHRGPDAEGTWCDIEAGVYLGHRRLSIIDIEGGSQPMWTADNSLGIVFNGEIYNHDELREELQQKGCVFQTDHSDTEVLLHGYAAWKEALPDRLNGMWAFAIYDRNNRSLFCSRDRFGKKPFFYTLMNGTFAFASELSALTKHARITGELSSDSLKKYFAYAFIPAPHSIYRTIYKLPGGHNLTLSIPELLFRIEKYWEFSIEPFEKIPEDPEQEWGEQIRALLEKSIQYRLMSDVPLGVLLSGGIDSSSITAMAARILGKGNLKTFTMGFSEKSFDESAQAERTARLFETDHYSEMFSLHNAIPLLPVIAGKIDEPLGDSSLIPTYILSSITRKKVTVALGGDGGDELFAGYDPFVALSIARWYAKIIPRPIHRAIRLLMSHLPTSHRYMSLDFKIKRTLRGLSYGSNLWNPVWLGPLEPTELSELFREPVNIEEVYAEAIQCWDSCRQNNPVDRTLEFYTKLYLQDDILVKVDRMSMAHSLEVRAPFLDRELVDFVRRIPASFKIRNGQKKYLLKKALEPLLPRDILCRKKKGFGMPIGLWFREGQVSAGEPPGDLRIHGPLLKRLIDDHRSRRADNRLFLWNYWVLEHWLNPAQR